MLYLKNSFQNFVRKMVAIVSMPWCIKLLVNPEAIELKAKTVNMVIIATCFLTAPNHYLVHVDLWSISFSDG